LCNQCHAAGFNGDRRAIGHRHGRYVATDDNLFAFKTHGRYLDYSVLAVSPAWVIALCNVCQAKLAHLTRTGNSRTPDNTSNFPKSRPSGCVSVSIRCMSLNSASTSDNGMPFTASVMSEADAVEMAHPCPTKLMSSTRSSLTFTKTVSRSPQRGLCPSATRSASSIG